MRIGFRGWIAIGVGALPCLLALVACSTDGATPNCSAPDAGCEPSGPDLNPDAHFDGGATPSDAAKKDGDAGPVTDTGADTATDALEAGDAPSDAKLDGDAKG